MQHTTKYVLVLLTIFTAILSGCYEDSEHLTTTVIPDRPTIVVTGDVALSLNDESGTPLNDGLVFIDAQNVTLDGDRFIPLHLGAVEKRSTMVVVDVPGFKSVPYQVILEPNDVAYVHKQIVTDRNEREVSPDQNNSISIGGSQIDIPSMTLRLGGNVYTGPAVFKGFEKQIDTPSDLLFIPGSRVGEDQDGAAVWLDIKTLLNIEVYTSSGTELTFAPGTAVVTVPDNWGKPFKLDVSGRWSEIDHVSTGGEITFGIDEGGYYCVAEDSPGVIISGSVGQDGIVLPHVELRASLGGRYVAQAYTSNSGVWEMFLPANSDLQCEVISHCGEVFRDGITTGDLDDILNFDLKGEFDISQLTGVARDCKDDPLPGHFMEIVDGSFNNVLYFDNPDFNTAIATCGETISIRSNTKNWNQTGALVEWPANDDIDIHSTYACEEAAEEYLAMRINGESKVYWITSAVKSSDDRVLITAEDPAQPGEELTLWIDGTSSGIYDDMSLNILYADRDEKFSQGGYSVYCPTSEDGCGFQKFEITHFGSTGEWIRGNFEGRFWVKTFDPLTAGYKDMSGEFQVYRDF